MKPADVKYLVVHCSATPAARDIGVKEIRAMHLARKFSDVGYHWVVRRNGRIEAGRAESQAGAHVSGFNSRSLGICLVGGVRPDGRTAECNFTAEQYRALAWLLASLAQRYPAAEVLGHRDLSPDRNGDGKVSRNEWLKECPTFDVRPWWAAARPKPAPAAPAASPADPRPA